MLDFYAAHEGVVGLGWVGAAGKEAGERREHEKQETILFTRDSLLAQSVGVNSESATDGSSLSAEDARLDKWLWLVRVYKTRALAAEACRLGRVQVEGREAKPAAMVRAGQVVEAKQGLVTRRLVVLGIPRGRQGAARVAEFARDETPPEMLAAAREQRVQNILEGGKMKPSKRDLRVRRKLFGQSEEP
jgi:ribosome-associated heat shock protein Hsp15